MAKKLQKSSDFSAFFNNLIDVCDSKNISVTTLIDKYASSRSAMTAWKNGTINADIIPKLALDLDISIDRLLTGKESQPMSHNLTQDKIRLIEMYDMLTDMEKGEILGELKHMVKEKQFLQPAIRTAEIAARSTNNAPPRIETGDFSDILNAPDSTDNYR